MTFLASRRGFLAGLGSLLVAAPAVVRAEILMPVRSIERLISPPLIGPYSFDSFDRYVPAATQYQWATKTIMGEPVGNLDGMLMRGWKLVPAQRHRGDFHINGDAIEHGGCVLVERPQVVHQSVRQQEIDKAHSLVGDWISKLEDQGMEVRLRDTRSGEEQLHYG